MVVRIPCSVVSARLLSIPRLVTSVALVIAIHIPTICYLMEPTTGREPLVYRLTCPNQTSSEARSSARPPLPPPQVPTTWIGELRDTRWNGCALRETICLV
ncbi:hypothetical protein F4809DRAFT_605508 [Biscogniauxia mediterranea]|nr:hypothetical protein F4809DRAFT_605508 [Biscogniauxia mediterranea]